ncbi:beta-galactosidase-1-like protein 3 [Sitophilus oryzae]|uniref:Beta-galactosidase n=1 Tax=Sitophilus oryzae TaxID=7048 RepID=A0A6J2X5Y3_SITOR|nr:beta-galactosidase-1-like protein 3 [Sitophilus oryzae]
MLTRIPVIYMMMPSVLLLCLLVSFSLGDLPTNYEYYTSDGISSGLSTDQPTFYLNGKEIYIYSGAIHYFRVPRAYWRDRLRKLRAAGFNTVETYIAWNLHEYQSGVYDFGNGGSDMEDFLHLEEFIQTAQDEDLFVIIRSGPFICAEFEFGGFPSFILRDGQDLWVRTDNELYMNYVTRWYNVLMPILAQHQFTKGGPIIMLQVENEYAITGYKDHNYLWHLRQLMLDNGIVELLVTADNPWKGTDGAYPEYFLMTGNFDSDAQTNLDTLKSLQPNKPIMVMEYWSGWFDYWGQQHQNKTADQFKEVYEAILSYPASVNMYMFIGGTNFYFLSGAQNLAYDDLNTKFTPMTTSYDYGAPLAENGAYTDKYWIAQELIAKYNPIQTKLPAVPDEIKPIYYPWVTLDKQITLDTLLIHALSDTSSNLISMENMNINGGSGQSYGYVVYRKTGLTLSANSVLKIEGRVCDTVIVLVNGVRVSPILETSSDLNNFGTWRTNDSTLILNTVDLTDVTVDLLVENWGRVNVGAYRQYKGLWEGNVLINGNIISDWTLYALEFKKSWTNSLTDWTSVTSRDINQPVLYKGTLSITGTPGDSYVYMEEFTKGIVIINGFVLGRYTKMGPQQTLYLPAPLLKEGDNDIMIFEHYQPAEQVKFVIEHVYTNH